MEPENPQQRTVASEARVQLPAQRTVTAVPPTETALPTLPPRVAAPVETTEARRDSRDWAPAKENLHPLVSPYKIGIEVNRGTVSFDETTRSQFLEKVNLGRGQAAVPAGVQNFDEAVQAMLRQPVTPEQFEKMVEDVQKFKTFQTLCSIKRHWKSIGDGGNEPDNAPLLEEALDRRVGEKLYMKILFSERTIMGVSVSINKLLKAGYLTNEDFAGKDPKFDIIDQRVLKPFLQDVLIPADFIDMPPEYMPWVIQELTTRTEDAARNHPAVKRAGQRYIQDQLKNVAEDWISTLTRSKD